MSILMIKEKLEESEEIVIMPQVPEVLEEEQLTEDHQEAEMPQLRPRKKKPQLNDLDICIPSMLVLSINSFMNQC